MRNPNQPTFARHIDAAGYGSGQPRPMDEDDALEQAEAEIRKLNATVKCLMALCEAARPTVVQRMGNKCLEWLETLDLCKEGKI